ASPPSAPNCFRCCVASSRLRIVARRCGSPEGGVEAKLVRVRVPGRDWDSLKVKWIGSRGNLATPAGTAAAKPGSLHDLSSRGGDVVAAAKRKCKRLDRRRKLPPQVQPRADNLLLRHRNGNLAEIDVGSRMGADVEPFPVQGPHFVPGHPGIPGAPLFIPERHDISA